MLFIGKKEWFLFILLKMNIGEILKRQIEMNLNNYERIFKLPGIVEIVGNLTLRRGSIFGLLPINEVDLEISFMIDEGLEFSSDFLLSYCTKSNVVFAASSHFAYKIIKQIEDLDYDFISNLCV